MNIALVVGFFDPVKKSLNEAYPESVYRDRLIWVPPGKSVIASFKGRFYDVMKTAEGLLVCLGRSESQLYLEQAVRGIVESAQAQNTRTPVSFQVFGNLYDATPVIDAVKAFGIETEPAISSDRIRGRVPDGKILCMSLYGKTTILTALQRAGFSIEAIHECFEEEIRVGARNSNLMQDLQMRAATHSHLLYAWEGLRTSTPAVKKGFRHGCHEARSASQVVDLFKKWIVETSETDADKQEETDADKS